MGKNVSFNLSLYNHQLALIVFIVMIYIYCYTLEGYGVCTGLKSMSTAEMSTNCFILCFLEKERGRG